jgi:hypothetical protein
MSISLQDLQDWHDHPVTRVLIARMKHIVSDDSMSLVSNAPQMHPGQMRDRAIEIAAISRFIADLEGLEIDDLN